MKNINELDEEDEEETQSPFQLSEEIKKHKKTSSFKKEEAQKLKLEKQINFLKNSNKNIITLIRGKTELASNPFFQYRLENNSINLFLINIYKKTRMNDIISISNNLKCSKENILNKIEILQKKVTSLENEINWVAQEKIDGIIEKERLSDVKEIMNYEINNSNKTDRLNNVNMSLYPTNNLNSNNFLSNRNYFNPFINDNKLSELKTQYHKLYNLVDKAKCSFPNMKNKIAKIKNNNINLQQQIKQKKMIYEQINNELESLKEEFEKINKKNQSQYSVSTQTSGNSNNDRKGVFRKIFKGLFG